MLSPNRADFLICRELAALSFCERGFDISLLLGGELIGRPLAGRKLQQHPREFVLHIVRQSGNRGDRLFEELRHNSNYNLFWTAWRRRDADRAYWRSFVAERSSRSSPTGWKIPPESCPSRALRPFGPPLIYAPDRGLPRNFDIVYRGPGGSRRSNDRQIEPSLGQAASGPAVPRRKGCELWLRLSASTWARQIPAWPSWKVRRPRLSRIRKGRARPPRSLLSPTTASVSSASRPSARR